MMARAIMTSVLVVLEPSSETHSWEVLKMVTSRIELRKRVSLMIRRSPSSPVNREFSKSASSRFDTWSLSSQQRLCQYLGSGERRIFLAAVWMLKSGVQALTEPVNISDGAVIKSP
jgi:hypothetical protein